MEEEYIGIKITAGFPKHMPLLQNCLHIRYFTVCYETSRHILPFRNLKNSITKSLYRVGMMN